MTQTVRTKPTNAEAALLAANPTALFGFFVKTDAPAAAQLQAYKGVYVAEPAFKLHDGVGMHIITTPQDMQGVIAQLKEVANPVRQWLVMVNGMDQYPVYDATKLGTNKLPTCKDSLALTS